VTAPPIAPRLEAGVSEFGGVAVWMHDKQHIRSDFQKRKGKGASAIMPDLKRTHQVSQDAPLSSSWQTIIC